MDPSLPPTIIGLIIEIDYNGASGPTTRRVRCEGLWKEEEGDIYLFGWCFLRQDERTFNVKRISRLTRLPDGTLEPKPARFFRHYLPRRPLTEILESVRAELTILSFVANADISADYDPKIFDEYKDRRIAALKATACRKGIDQDINFDPYPTIELIKPALERIENESGHVRMLVPYVKQLMQTVRDIRLRQSEYETISAIRTRFC